MGNNDFLEGYRPFTPESVLKTPHLARIEQLAEGLSREEIVKYFGLDVSALGEDDQYNFEKAIRKGQVSLVTQATHALKTQMQGKDGVKAALAALTRFGEKWENADLASGATNFTLTLGD